MKTLEINSQPFLLNSNIEEGFLKGSAWDNLYSFFKYKESSYKPKGDLYKQIYALQVYTFLNIELTQYVCTHPNDVDAYNMLKRINADKETILNMIETKQTALSACSPILDGFFTLKPTWSDK